MGNCSAQQNLGYALQCIGPSCDQYGGGFVLLQGAQECHQVSLFPLGEPHIKSYIIELDHVLEPRG
jgi:hypothetical protein